MSVKQSSSTYWCACGMQALSRHGATPEFLGHAYSDTPQTEQFDCCAALGLCGLLQVSMDGPNVNFKTMQLLNSQIDGEVGHRLFDAGNCGMHTMHNAFRYGYATTVWDVEQSFTSLYWLFKDSPARREDYVSVTGS